MSIDHDNHAAEHQDEGYHGAATVRADDGTVVVDVGVRLRGGFQPIDGRYHWYGRLDRDDALEDLGRTGATVTVETPYGRASGKLSDRDPWGRFRLAGSGRPPFPTDLAGPDC